MVSYYIDKLHCSIIVFAKVVANTTRRMEQWFGYFRAENSFLNIPPISLCRYIACGCMYARIVARLSNIVDLGQIKKYIRDEKNITFERIGF